MPPLASRSGTWGNLHDQREGWKQEVWTVFESPSSSWLATGVNVFIFLCILAGTAVFCVETLPELQGEPYTTWFWRAEVFFVVVFSAEYILRFLSTPDTTWDFVTNPMNMIDLAAIAPFFIELYMTTYMHSSFVDMRFLRVIRLARILRLMKVGKYSTEIQILARATSRSWEAMVLLVCLLGSAIIIFGAIMYLLERGKWDAKMGCYVRDGDSGCSPFESIPLSFYWGVTTMTTVGYGDAFPLTPLGKLVACCAMVTGVFIIALPVAVMGDRFVDAYGHVTDETTTEKIIQEAQSKQDIHNRLEETIEKYKTIGEKCRLMVPRLRQLSNASLVQNGSCKDDEQAQQRTGKVFELLGVVLDNAHNDMMQFVEYQRKPHSSASATPQSPRSAAPSVDASGGAAAGAPGGGETAGPEPPAPPV